MEHFRDTESLSRRDIFETPDEERLVVATRELLSSLNEQTLRDIFERELQKSGVAAGEERIAERYIPFSKVGIDGTKAEGAMGTFSIKDGIFIYPQAIENSGQFIAQHENLNQVDLLCGKWLDLNKIRKESLSKSTTKLLEQVLSLLDDEITSLESRNKETRAERAALFSVIQTIHTITHEELHAITAQQGFSPQEVRSGEASAAFSGRKIIGLKDISYLVRYKPLSTERIIDEDYNRFTGLNEGVTELINRRLAKEFLEKSLPTSVISSDIEAVYELVEITSYNRERWVAEQLVLLLSVISEVPIDSVENGLFRAYLDGGEFLPEELTEAIQSDAPHLTHSEVERLVLKLQIAISSDTFFNGGDFDINRIFIEIADLLPPNKRDVVKDGFEELFYKYSFCKELRDSIEAK